MKDTHVDFSLPRPADPSWRVGIVHASYYKEEVDAMVTVARQQLLEAGIQEGNILLCPAAGSFEIPLIGAALAQAGRVDALIGLGIIVEGETEHAHLVAQNAARGMMDVQIRTGVPFALGVLHVHSLAQAHERASGENNKGKEAACAILSSLAQLQALRSRDI